MRLIDADAYECVSYKGVPDGYDNDFDCGVLWMLDRIDEQPTVQMPRWISVEERLPEPGQGVLIYDDCGYMSVADYSCDKYFPTVYEFHVNGEYEQGAKYWMPLPEPPEED